MSALASLAVKVEWRMESWKSLEKVKRDKCDIGVGLEEFDSVVEYEDYSSCSGS